MRKFGTRAKITAPGIASDSTTSDCACTLRSGSVGAAGWRSMQTQDWSATLLGGLGQHGCDGDGALGVPAQIPAGFKRRQTTARMARTIRAVPILRIHLDYSTGVSETVKAFHVCA